jgi:NAD(P)-dependent dehydrogenase (short-subunit alcohol dehydrogenase family)
MPSILITGGASGIGRASAERFAAAGWRVGLLDRDSEALILAASASQASFWRACDVTDAALTRAGIDDFATTDGLDLLLISHGVLRIGSFMEVDLDTHRRTIDINVTGNINVLHAAFPHLRARAAAGGQPQVISLCSASAVFGTPDFASYSASKFAVRALTEALSVEWAPHGIRVSDLWPPFVATPMLGLQTTRPAVMDKLPVGHTADDIAREIFSQASGGPLHRPVGLSFTLQYHLARLTPVWLMRLAYRWLFR